MWNELYVDQQGRFQMLTEELRDFIPFLRDHEVQCDVVQRDAFRAEGAPYSFARIRRPFLCDLAQELYRKFLRLREQGAQVA